MSKRKTELLNSFEEKDLIESSVFLKGNTLQIDLTNGVRVIRFHHTTIIKITDKTITLNSGGWLTPTTKERINTFCPFKISIYQRNNTWYFEYNDQTVMFYDGIMFDKLGTIISEIKVDKSKEITKLKRKIKKYVNLLDSMDEIPNPNSGDCWLCSLRSDDGKTMGEHWKDSEHFKSHLEEDYLHGSIIYNALKEKHGNDMFISLVFTTKHGLDHKSTIKRCLRRYLQDRLIPEIINS